MKPITVCMMMMCHSMYDDVTWLRVMFKRLVMYEADHGMYDDDVS
jgi:hypothetical protein